MRSSSFVSRLGRTTALVTTAGCSLAVWTAAAMAAVTPGWECIPKTAGHAVLSGGTGSAPSCGSGTTAVLAPTYIHSGVGGKPTVEFSAVNVQIVSGSGATAKTVNGRGNLVIGYAENPGKLARTGSNDLIVGSGNGWTSYGDIVGGSANLASGAFAAAFGYGNTVAGPDSLAAGHANRAAYLGSSVTGGQYNVAADKWASIAGGCDNLAGPGSVPTGPCSTSAQAILGGASNQALGTESTISGGQSNSASNSISTVAGGYSNSASGLGSSITGGYGNASEASESSISGGGHNTAIGSVSSIAGGYYNTATVDEASILGGCSNVAGAGTVSVNPGCTGFGDSFMAIVGGVGNQDTTVLSTILGGSNNEVSAVPDGALVGGHAENMSSSTPDLSRVGSSTFTP